MRYRVYGAMVLTCSFFLMLLAGKEFSESQEFENHPLIQYYVICPGGYMPAMNDQHIMWATLGEPVAGTSMNSSYRLGAGVWNTWTSSPPPVFVDDEATGPAAIKSYQNHPNPFNPATTIAYDLPSTSRVTIRIYNIHGQMIKTLQDNSLANAGSHRIVWDGRDSQDMTVSSGVYLYRLTVRTVNNPGEVYSTVRKMTLMK